MKAHEKGYCCELEIDDGDFVHICGLKLNHEHNHRCVCGNNFEDKK